MHLAKDTCVCTDACKGVILTEKGSQIPVPLRTPFLGVKMTTPPKSHFDPNKGVNLTPFLEYNGKNRDIT